MIPVDSFMTIFTQTPLAKLSGSQNKAIRQEHGKETRRGAEKDKEGGKRAQSGNKKNALYTCYLIK